MKINSVIKKIKSYFVAPFSANFAFFILFFVLIVSIETVIRLCKGHYSYLVFLLSWDFLVAYILSLPISLLGKKIKKVYLSLTVLMLSLYLIVDFYYRYIWKDGNYFEIPVAVQNTNSTEVSEFISSFLSVNFIGILLLIFIGIFILYWIINKYWKVNSCWWQTLCFMCVFACVLLCFHNPFAVYDTFLGKSNYWLVTFTQKTPDLKEYYQNPKVFVGEGAPTKLVIIIGESFSKRHSSLYGYEKNTNPKLSALEKKNLIVFENVTSPALTTVPSFKEFMNDHNPDGSDEREWYECLTIQEVLSKAGYHSTWLSNQHRVGFTDNLITAYANLSDETIFIKENEKYSSGYDGNLLPVLDSIHSRQNENAKELLWLHLLGSHHNYEGRYPPEKTIFTEVDYLDKPDHQRKNLSYYDNSILYNDYVVSNIINTFKDDDAIIVYFSDHGLDFYYTDSYYCYFGRGDKMSYMISREIPFMVYMTDKYIEMHPGRQEIVDSMKEKPFNTNQLIKVLTKIIDVRYK